MNAVGRFLRGSRVNLIVSCAAVLAILLGAALILAPSASPPVLAAVDLPLDYTEVEASRQVLGGCYQADNIIERYGVEESEISFSNGMNDYDSIDANVLRATDDRLWGELLDELKSCNPEDLGYEAAIKWWTNGPDIADESIWYSYEVTADDLTIELLPTTTVMFREGDWVTAVSGTPGMSQGEVARYARAMLD